MRDDSSQVCPTCRGLLVVATCVHTVSWWHRRVIGLVPGAGAASATFPHEDQISFTFNAGKAAGPAGMDAADDGCSRHSMGRYLLQQGCVQTDSSSSSTPGVVGAVATCCPPGLGCCWCCSLLSCVMGSEKSHLHCRSHVAAPSSWPTHRQRLGYTRTVSHTAEAASSSP